MEQKDKPHEEKQKPEDPRRTQDWERAKVPEPKRDPKEGSK